MRRVRAFIPWIEGQWGDDGPPEPPTVLAAVDADGWGSTVGWCETARASLGNVAEVSRCYHEPVEATPPAIERYPITVRSGRRQAGAYSPGG